MILALVVQVKSLKNVTGSNMKYKKRAKIFGFIATGCILIITILGLLINDFYIDIIRYQSANTSDIGVMNLSLLKAQLWCDNSIINDCRSALSTHDKNDQEINDALEKLREKNIDAYTYINKVYLTERDFNNRVIGIKNLDDSLIIKYYISGLGTTTVIAFIFLILSIYYTFRQTGSLKKTMENNIILQVGVKALLKNKEGKYLLIHRSQEKYPEVDNRWDIVGGRIDPGSTLLENLKREIKEETNLDLIGKPKLIAAQDILRINGKHIVRLTYTGEVKGKLELDQSEHDNYQWLSIEEIKKIDGLDKYFKELLDNNLL